MEQAHALIACASGLLPAQCVMVQEVCVTLVLVLQLQAALHVALEADISALAAMGFARSKAKAALMEAGGSVEDALDWLLRAHDLQV